MRRLAVTAAFVSAIALTVAFAPDDPNPYAAQAATRRSDAELVQGRNVGWWARHAVQARKDANARAHTIRRLRHVLRVDVTIQDAIDLAATTFKVDAATLSRKASCESTGGNGYRPSAHNPASDAQGLFQFEPATWASTPYARFSPYDPLAASLAAGWMHRQGRGGEWTCQ